MNNESQELLPREKAMKFGVKSLSDRELMAILFGTGVKGKNVFELCDEILKAKSGHLSLVTKMDCDEFTRQFKGIGPAKALTLLAALELGVRASADALTVVNEPLSTSKIAYESVRPVFYGLDHEQFWIAFLDRSNKLIKKMRVGQGGLSYTAVDVRVIMREALVSRASGIILFHNHPSGNLKPSSPDKKLTERVAQCAKVFDLRVLDHIIVNDNTYYSFSDEGEMPV